MGKFTFNQFLKIHVQLPMGLHFHLQLIICSWWEGTAPGILFWSVKHFSSLGDLLIKSVYIHFYEFVFHKIQKTIIYGKNHPSIKKQNWRCSETILDPWEGSGWNTVSHNLRKDNFRGKSVQKQLKQLFPGQCFILMLLFRTRFCSQTIQLRKELLKTI